jgi:hypothetical protein
LSYWSEIDAIEEMSKSCMLSAYHCATEDELAMLKDQEALVEFCPIKDNNAN